MALVRLAFRTNARQGNVERYQLKKVVTPVAKRDAVTHLQSEYGVSEWRACSVLKIDRSSVRYKSVRLDDADLREAMKQVASERRRFGYRRIHVMLERQGHRMNEKKPRRLYRKRSYKYANVEVVNAL